MKEFLLLALPQLLIPWGQKEDPRDLLGHATRAANSSKAAAAQNFWRLLKKVRSPGIFVVDFGMGQNLFFIFFPYLGKQPSINHRF